MTITIPTYETPTTVIPTHELVELRQQVNYWKTQHQRSLERERKLRETVDQQAVIIREQAKEIKALKEENEKIKAELTIIKKMLFGDKQEKQFKMNQEGNESSDGNNPEDSNPVSRRNRGQQEGSKGHGRRTHDHLPTEEVFYDLREEEKRCPICGEKHKRLDFTEDSEEITIEIVIKRILHKRYQYEPSCQCQCLPGLLAAEGPLKLFPKTKFSMDFWIHMLMEKYLYQRPSYRSLHHLHLEGLSVSQGTITGRFEKILPMVIPLYAAIVERSRGMSHWHMDETRWLVFANDDEGDKKKRWWLWVMANRETCVYVIDPTRSREVVLRHLGETPEGIISSDRYSVYQNICESILYAYCWAHLRRDFIRIHEGHKRLRPWAEKWIETIAHIYQLNDQRLQEPPGSKAFEIADQKLHQEIKEMEETFKEQLKDDYLRQTAKKVLISLEKRWERYCTFVDHPEIPMDNNFAERKLRNPAVGRKNYYGSGAVWTATLTATMFTLFQTLLLHQIHPRKFLQ
jgi:transposase